jgi:hypothetical protein
MVLKTGLLFLGNSKVRSFISNPRELLSKVFSPNRRLRCASDYEQSYIRLAEYRGNFKHCMTVWRSKWVGGNKNFV